MNATVARIVEIMFQDTEMNEEVQALKDEVMNNCQERYNDMIARGLSEDEATAAVVDSLKGMEEVISQYPRKKAEEDDFDEDELDDDDDEDEDEDTEVDHTFDPESIRMIRVNLISDDVTVESSFDDRIHVCYDREDLPNLEVRREGNVLVVERSEGSGNRHIHMDFNGKGMKWDSFSDMFKDIGRMISGSGIGFTIGRVTISLPKGHALAFEGHTTSGDMEISSLTAEVNANTVSGDLTVQPEEAVPMLVSLKSTSGDLNLEAPDGATVTAQLKSISGDVHNRCRDEGPGSLIRVTAQTVSGDIFIH